MDKEQLDNNILPFAPLLPIHFSSYSEEQQANIISYVGSLSPIQKKALSIAKDHLGTSFDILRSNGYVHWTNSK